MVADCACRPWGLPLRSAQPTSDRIEYIPPGNLRIAVFFYAEKLCSKPAPIWCWRGNPAFLLPVQWQANNRSTASSCR